jgi:hypothetical protein
MILSTDGAPGQRETTNSEFQPVSSYVPVVETTPEDASPRMLFDVRSMRLIETSTISDRSSIKYVAVSYSRNERCPTNLHDPAISWKIRFATSDWLSNVCDKVKETQIDYLWLDSLCINQDSDEDKELQIPLMGGYYHGAELVLVVLDDLEQYRDQILSSAGTIANIPEQIRYKPTYYAVPDWFDLKYFVAAHTIISIISKSRWSKRIWTVQEIRLAKRAIYFIPGIGAFSDVQLSTLAMLKYMGASSKIENSTKHMTDLPIGVYVTDSLVVDSIIPNKSQRYLPITGARQLFLGRDSALEQDRVYGMLGLLCYGEKLKADYSLTLCEIEKELYRLASDNGDNTWISGNGERHRDAGWGIAMKSHGIPIPGTLMLFSAPRISDGAIDIAGSVCGRWAYVKELTSLLEPGAASSREVPLTKTCTSIITAISMRSHNLESCINALKAGFYLYGNDADYELASMIKRNGIFDGWLLKFFLNGIGAWSKEKLKGKDEGALFANATARMYGWYGFGRRLSLLKVNTNGKDNNYRAVASLEHGQISGLLLAIGLVSREMAACIPVIKVKGGLARVGGLILIPLNEMDKEPFIEDVSIV